MGPANQLLGGGFGGTGGGFDGGDDGGLGGCDGAGFDGCDGAGLDGSDCGGLDGCDCGGLCGCGCGGLDGSDCGGLDGSDCGGLGCDAGAESVGSGVGNALDPGAAVATTVGTVVGGTFVGDGCGTAVCTGNWFRVSVGFGKIGVATITGSVGGGSVTVCSGAANSCSRVTTGV